MSTKILVEKYSQNLKQLKSPTGERISTLWYVYTMKHYSAIKTNELLITTTTWMNLTDIILREEKASHKGVQIVWFYSYLKMEWEDISPSLEVTRIIKVTAYKATMS